MKKEIKDSFKVAFVSVLGGAFAVFVFTLFLILIGAFDSEHSDEDCWKQYVTECLECHTNNQDYALCSGFCYGGSNQTMNDCLYSLNESCFDIPVTCDI